MSDEQMSRKEVLRDIVTVMIGLGHEDHPLFLARAEALIQTRGAAIAALGGGWLPIESAPQGVYVLLGNPEWASPGCGAKEDGEWLDFGFAYDPPPTHWMPLPAPPSKEG